MKIRRLVVCTVILALLTSCSQVSSHIDDIIVEGATTYDVQLTLLDTINSDIFFYSFGGAIECRDTLKELCSRKVEVKCYTDDQEALTCVLSVEAKRLEIVYPYSIFGLDPQYQSMKILESAEDIGKEKRLVGHFTMNVPEVHDPYPSPRHYPNSVATNLMRARHCIAQYGQSIGQKMEEYNICFGNYQEHPYLDDDGNKKYYITVFALFRDVETNWDGIARVRVDNAVSAEIIEMVDFHERYTELDDKRAFSILCLLWKPEYYPHDFLGI